MKAQNAHGVFVGLATLDVIYSVERLPHTGEKIDSLALSTAAGGPAANAAVAFSACGGDATLITKLSDDAIGAVIRDDLESQGVRVISYGGSTDAPATVSSVLIDPEGERTIVSSADNRASTGAGEGISAFAPEEDREFVDALRSQYNAGALTLMDSYYLDLAQKAAWAAQRSDKPLVLDVGRERPHSSAQLSAADIPIVSRAFCAERSLHDTICYMRDHGCQRGAITNGADAITFWHPESDPNNRSSDSATVGQILPENAENVVDTLGAGDFFHGAFMYAEAVKPSGSSREAFIANLRFASRVAGDSVRSLGTRQWLQDFSPLDI